MKTHLLLIIAALAVILANAALAQTWTQTSAPITNWTAVASSADGTKLIAATSGGCCNQGAIYLSTNSGASWSSSAAPTASWQAVASSANGTKLVAAGSPGGGAISFSQDSGATWMPSSETNIYFQSLAASADGTKLIGGFEYQTYTSTDSGATWTFSTVGGFRSASSADGNRLAIAYFYYNGSPSGGIFISTNAGASWTQTSAPVNGWSALASSADGTTLAATRGPTSFPTCCGPIYVSTDSGASWVASATPSVPWTSIAASADGSRLVAASSGGGAIYTSKDWGATWTSNNVPLSNWSAVASCTDGSKLVAVVNGGGIYSLQSTPTPVLNITPSGINLLLSWIVPSTDFVLQENSDLTTANWEDVTNKPTLNLSRLQYQVAVTPPTGHRFYRLKQ